jgi:hypothetical protein
MLSTNCPEFNLKPISPELFFSWPPKDPVNKLHFYHYHSVVELKLYFQS